MKLENAFSHDDSLHGAMQRLEQRRLLARTSFAHIDHLLTWALLFLPLPNAILLRRVSRAFERAISSPSFARACLRRAFTMGTAFEPSSATAFLRWPPCFQAAFALEFLANKTDIHWDAPSSEGLQELDTSLIIVPAALGELKRLRRLVMRHQNLTGPLPKVLARLSRITTLDLSYNRIVSFLPLELMTSWQNLGFLSLAHNPLSGPIPRDIGCLSGLRNLCLSHANLSGTIPLEIGTNLLKLRSLDLGHNCLTGTIPPELGELILLEDLKVNDNQLTGCLPVQVVSLPRIIFLDLSANKLMGCLPPQIALMAHLVYLFLNDNKFSGPVPEELTLLLQLEYLKLSSNDFTSVPRNLGLMPNLLYVYLGDNPRMSLKQIPSSLLKGNLVDLTLNKCGLTSTLSLPQSTLLGNLTFLDLSDNVLTGGIPDSFQKLQCLQNLTIARNALSGELPLRLLSRLRQLNVLNLQGNHFSGEIAWELLPSSITDVDLSDNAFEGCIRMVSHNFSPGLERLVLSNNQFSGCIPSMSGFNRLRELRLDRNVLVGKIPAELARMRCLDILHLHGNPLDGRLSKREWKEFRGKHDFLIDVRNRFLK